MGKITKERNDIQQEKKPKSFDSKPSQKHHLQSSIKKQRRPGNLPFKAGKSRQDFKIKEKIKEKRAAQAQQVAAKAAEAAEQRQKQKQEKDERIQQYKKKRLERTKIISKRTHRGQPLMKDRMEYLLKQIQTMKHNG